MKLSWLAMVLGLGVALPQVFALLKPAAVGAVARQFPRSRVWGYLLMLLGTGWFLYYLQDESVADFAAYKPYMIAGFALVGILTCVFVSDFLAVRGAAIVILLLAKLMTDSARWVDSPWRLVLVVWAYLLVIAGIWFTIAPWRLRDLIEWATASESRIRFLSSLRLAFGLLVFLLGLTVF